MKDMVHSGAESAPDPWGPGGERVKAAVRGLTRAEKRVVAAGYISDCRMATVRSLQRKGMFYLHIDSPNGMCGIMRLTPLGINARSAIARATGSAG